MAGADIGRIAIDGRVRHVVARDASDAAVLPEIPGAIVYDEPLPDRIGRLLREHRALSVVGGIAAGALAARFGGGGMVRRSVAAMAAAGAAPLLGATLVGALRGSDPRVPRTAARVGLGAGAQATDGAEQLRVMTFNVREAIGPTGEIGGGEAVLDAIAAEIARERPDVVLLQEVTNGSPQGRWADVPAELARRLDPTSLDVGWSGTRMLGFQKGNAVMTFGEARVVDSRVLQLDDPHGKGVARRAASLLAPVLGDHAPSWVTSFNARSALDAVVETGGGRRIRVVSTHLGGDATQRLQLDPLAAALDASEAPTILAGDFNTKSTSAAGAREAALLGRAGLADAFSSAGVAIDDPARRSYPALRPTSPIDRVYASRGIHVRDARVAEPASASSDHRGVVADLTVR